MDFTVGPDELLENSGDEPGRSESPTWNSKPNSAEEFETMAETSVPSNMHHPLCSGADSPDDSRPGFLDTACTSCMRSRAWREASPHKEFHFCRWQ